MLSRHTAAALAVVTTVFAAVPAEAQSRRGPSEHEITVTITRVRALDLVDAFSKADFFPRVTIDGAVQSLPPVKQQADITPNWVIVKKVKPGRVAVKLEILDKDLTKEEAIDINKVAGKRHQDFTVDTRSCRIEGFAGSPRCGATITRAGDERKKAEISFTVSVKK